MKTDIELMDRKARSAETGHKSDEMSFRNDGRTWYALFVKARHEFIVNEALDGSGIEAYLPAATSMRRWKDRTKKILFPLFPGYVFVCISDREEYRRALKTRGVVNFVSLEHGSPTPVDAEEISALKSIIAAGIEYDLHPGLFNGSRVRMVQGVLKGTAGVLQRRENGQIFFVNIEIFGRSIGIKVDAGDIGPE